MATDENPKLPRRYESHLALQRAPHGNNTTIRLSRRLRENRPGTYLKMNTLTKNDWAELYKQLVDTFGETSSNPPAKMAMIFAELATFKTKTVKQAVTLIIHTNNNFPSLAQLLATTKQLENKPNKHA